MQHDTHSLTQAVVDWIGLGWHKTQVMLQFLPPSECLPRRHSTRIFDESRVGLSMYKLCVVEAAAAVTQGRCKSGQVSPKGPPTI